MVVSFFRNNFRCTDHLECGSGASCAIDVLLEIYHFGIFKRTCNQDLIRNKQGLVGSLNSASSLREANGGPTCMIRKPVWNWLVDNIPHAFAPRGRPDAEILEGLKCIGKETAFAVKKASACSICGHKLSLEDSVVPTPLPITVSVAERVHGFLPDAVSAAVLQHRCRACNEKKIEKVVLPEFLMLEIGLVNYKNRQDPPILIPEQFLLCQDLKYELVGAVMVRPEHFYCIVKVENSFVILDDLKECATSYQCFSGAVSRDLQLLQDHHLTSPFHDGIHILLYATKVGHRLEEHTLTILETDTSFETNCCMKKVSAQQNSERGAEKQSSNHELYSNREVKTTCSYRKTQCIELKQDRTDNCHSRLRASLEHPMFNTQSTSGESREKSLELGLLNLEAGYKDNEVQDKKTVLISECVGDTAGKLALYGSSNSIDKTPEMNLGYVTDHFPVSNTAVSRKLMHDSKKGYITVLGQVLSCTSKNGKLFVECREFFEFSGLKKNISKEGYRFIDSRLRKNGLDISDEFIFSGKKQRTFISLEAVKSVLKGRMQVAVDSVALLHDIEKAVFQDSDEASDSKKANRIWDYRPSGTITLNGEEIKYKLSGGKNNDVNLLCEDVFAALGIEKRIKDNGYGFIHSCLKKAGLTPQNCFIRKGHVPVYITLKAVLVILDCSVVSKDKKHLKTSLVEVLAQDVAVAAMLKKQMSTPKRKKLLSPVTVFSSPKTTKFKNSKPVRKKLTWKKKDTQRKRQAKALKSAFKSLCAEHFNGDKKSFLGSMSVLIKSSNKKQTDNDSSLTFEGCFSPDDIVYILRKTQGRKNKKGGQNNLLEQLILSHAKDVFNFLPSDLIYLQENFSGTRLFDELRRRLPGIIPSQKVERSAKKELKKEFQAVLLPKRTPSGWQIDPGRLLEVLSFKYHDILGEKHWKIYGDGREIGGRQSTFIALSILNNEAFFIDGSFQNPKNMYPVNIFYESDSRDNLEENLGFPCKVDAVFSRMKNDTFHLAGDEMFLEAVLDASGDLGPMTETGWNIYRKCDKESKGKTALNGLRADMSFKIERIHNGRLFTTVPTERTVLCVLHAVTRCVEKFLNLEIQNILSEGNKETQRGGDGEGFKIDAIHNLEANINKRGIRQSNFRVLFDKSGSPEPVSLNKDHAIAVISPSSPAFPHILSGVVKERRITLQMCSEMKHKLGFSDSYTEYEMTVQIWEHFYEMAIILLRDPLPSSMDPNDSTEFQWGYSKADRINYIQHAEKFYHLFCARYTYKQLTPYMIKLIDHAPELMLKLPYPLARFQSEGGEHLNYQHNCFYFQHTTRHGGRGKPDPIVALFQACWNRLYYQISQLSHSDQDGERATGQSFSAYCMSHTAAVVIQRFYRGYIVRRKLETAGWTLKPMSGQQRKSNATVKRGIEQFFPRAVERKDPLAGNTFILVGAIPAKKRMTQSAMKELIVQKGGRVKTSIPFRQKGISTKKYIVLTTQDCLERKKVPSAIKIAVRWKCNVLSYDYIFKCLEEEDMKISQKDFTLNTTKISTGLTKELSVGKKHFHKSKTFISILKKARKVQLMKKTVKNVGRKKYQNAAQFFVASCLKKLSEKLPMLERRKFISDLFRQWKSLPVTLKMKYQKEWESCKGHF